MKVNGYPYNTHLIFMVFLLSSCKEKKLKLEFANLHSTSKEVAKCGVPVAHYLCDSVT